MKVEYSEGPWAVDHSEHELVVVDRNGRFICNPHGKSVGQQIDNATLIAAAPDILEALTVLMDRVTRHDGCSRYGIDDVNAWNQGQKAVKKATGSWATTET